MKKITYRSLLLSMLAVVIVGCATEHGFDKFHDKHEEKASGKCAAWYPSVASTKSTTEIRTGRIDTVKVAGQTEYITVDCDSAVAATAKAGGKTVIKVPYTVHDIEYVNRVDTVFRHDTTTLVNNAQATHLTLRAEKAENLQVALHQKAKMNFWWAIIATIIIVVRVVWKLIFTV